MTPASRPAMHWIAPAAILAVVALMIVPMPPLLLDLLLSIDIGLAVVLLLTAIYVKEPVEFSVFPSLLLVLTLLRLSLNVAGTRLILLDGADGVDAAGNVIMAFGQFVVGGNFVVGIVVFLVLVTIQFVVINHGAVRISEVTARFTLDALPGKQMAIDADLNAGLIDERQARERRDKIRREADFYGAMDGAIRFTQRDAMAAMLITAVNIVAGLVIGVMQRGMPLSEAAQTFTILTVGEGLVTAIPALLVSMSGGLITTRAASESPLGEEVASQLLTRARPLAVAAGALLLLAAIPGLPKTAFITVGALLGLAAWINRNAALAAPVEDAAPAAPASDTPDVAAVDPLGVEVGYALISLVDEKQGGTLLSRIRSIRKQIATDSGLVVPPVHVADNLQLGPRTYAILVKGVEVARGELMPDRMLAINPGTATTAVDGIATHGAGVRPAGVVDPERAARSRLDGRLHGGRSDDRAVDAPVRDGAHVPARSPEPPADEGAPRQGGADVAAPGRGSRPEGAVDRRRAARAAPAAARARADPRPDHDPRSAVGRRRRDQGPGRADRGRPRSARSGHLPAVPVRSQRAGRRSTWRRASRSA